VQFTDLQCPFCSRFYPPIKEILKAYPDKVRFMVKNFPLSFHSNARPAAKVALAAAEQGKYIEMVELLLVNGADVSEGKLKEYAEKLNIDLGKLNANLKANDAQYEQQIQDETNLGAQVDVRGTPTFYINGKKTMARDFNGFKSEIDKILAEK
jgi:protein-disulfide isomerase